MNYQSRINKLIGQLEAISRISNNNEDCQKILQQVKAVEGGIISLKKHIIDESLEKCLGAKDSQKEAKKIINSIRRYM